MRVVVVGYVRRQQEAYREGSCMSARGKLRQMICLSVIVLSASSQSAKAWCVLNDSVLPLALFGQPESRTTKDQIENLKAEIKCLEHKKNETLQDDFYRYNFYGLDND